jgi:hypothetical protein
VIVYVLTLALMFTLMWFFSPRRRPRAAVA